MMVDFMFFNRERFEREMNKSLFDADYEKELVRLREEFGDSFTLEDVKIIEGVFGGTYRLSLGNEIKFRPYDSDVSRPYIDLIYPLMLSYQGIFGNENNKLVGKVFVEEGETPVVSSEEGFNGLYGLVGVQFYKSLSLENGFEINPGGSDYSLVSRDGCGIDFLGRQDYEFKLNVPGLREFDFNRRKVDLSDKLPSPQSMFGVSIWTVKN